MSYTITRTKVLRPRRSRDTLSRSRLLGMLDDLLEYRLALVSAPAGFGKTTLLVDFAESAAYPVCWLSLDPLDNDPLRFLSHLIAAVQEHFPAFGGPSRSLISNLGGGEIDQDRVIRTLINDLYDHIEEHFALVLDDFHLVEKHPWVSSFVNHFAQEVDENCHLVIASRSLLSLPDLPLMIGRSQVKGLSFEELAFEPAEIQALYQIKYNQEVSQLDAEAIARETEGWITGLLLTAETSRGGLNGQGSAARAAGIDLYDYLASQVLDQQSPEMQSFMTRSSLLEEFNSDLCRETLGKPPAGRSWADLIGELLQKNLFIQPVEDGGTWLRYHHLFGDFLRQRCLETDPAGSRKLLQTLVEAYTQRGWWEKAYAACLLLGDSDKKAIFIETASSSLAHSGRLNLLASWIDSISKKELEKRPKLLAHYASLMYMRGDPETGLQMLSESLTKITGEEDDDIHLQSLLHVRRANLLRYIGKYEEGLKDAQKALDLSKCDQQGAYVGAEASREIGLNLNRLGKNQEAKIHLEMSLSNYQSLRDSNNAGFVVMDLGFMAMNEGDFSNARKCYSRAFTLWEEMGNINQLVGLCNNLGVLEHLCGEYIEAYNWLTRALEYSRQTGNLRHKAFALTSLADLALDLEALTRSGKYLNEATTLAGDLGEIYLQGYLRVTRASLTRRNKQFESAKTHLDAAHAQIRENPNGVESGKFHLEWGRIWLAENQLELAGAELKTAGEIFSQANSPVDWAAALIFLAWVKYRESEWETALALLERAGQILQELGTITPLVPLLAGEKGLLADLILLFPPDSYLHTLNRAVIDFLASLPGIQAALGFQDAPGLGLLEPAIDIQALGHELVRREGKAVDAPEWTKQKTVRELFFYLLSQPEGATREEICAIFWPDSSPEQLKKQFKNALYRLRRAVGKEAFLYHQPTRLYYFNRELDYRYDVEEFRLAAVRAENEDDPERAIHHLRQAADLYRHPFAPTLEGIWAEPVRFRLFTLYENTSLALARLLLERGNHRGALNTCTRLLEISPGQEKACRLAMQALAARGDRPGIERVYQACRRALDRELDAEPSPKTASLYQKLID